MEANGLSFVSKVIEQPIDFPEDTVLTAGEILATLATTGTNSLSEIIRKLPYRLQIFASYLPC